MTRRAKLGLVVLALSLTAVGGVSARQSTAPVALQAPSAPVAPAPDSVQPRPATPVVQSDAVEEQPVAKPAVVKPATAAKPLEPAKRARSNVAILQALDKVTTETMRFEAPVGQPIRYKTLIFTVRACETSASDEVAPESTAYVLVDTQPKAVAGRVAPPGRQVYKGWMYANSPGMNPLQHPVYDAWLIACKTSAPVAPAEKR
ncbi:DUF2155 domain-containing protein [Caulobacter henricii]|uniref:DUF2155 domain-containing protein n=1 Tax=Caulobacter henricii TaxID=69395 RepID=A0A0P0NZM5_9CAUL|nr:DUF2155 domain-containing protein [Caulobacter henricii]ALL13510.1 hypothetical protein AQ619_09190 [Caulobacter henricii]